MHLLLRRCPCIGSPRNQSFLFEDCETKKKRKKKQKRDSQDAYRPEFTRQASKPSHDFRGDQDRRRESDYHKCRSQSRRGRRLMRLSHSAPQTLPKKRGLDVPCL